MLACVVSGPLAGTSSSGSTRALPPTVLLMATAAVGWVSGFPTDQLTADDIERICENYRSDPTYVLKYFNEVGTKVR